LIHRGSDGVGAGTRGARLGHRRGAL
jgi:hypothetical protein